MELTADEIKCANRVRSVWDEARERYQLREDLDFQLTFIGNANLAREYKRNTAAQARTTWLDNDGNRKLCEVRLNRLAIVQNPLDMLEDTIPHEVAHLVCHLRPYLGRGHDNGWRTVCLALGGSGKATFVSGETYSLYQRKRYIYQYRIPDEGCIFLSDVKHNRVQKQNGPARYLTLNRTPILPEYFTGVRE